jgi:hypothetical protein
MIRGLFDPPVPSGSRGTPPLGRPRRGEGRALASPPRDAAAEAGGADRARTGDPLVANQVLSQLSYSPGSSGLVGLSGFEPLTSRLSAVRSSQLSYRPVVPGPPLVRGRKSRGDRLPKSVRRARRPRRVAP